MFDKREDVKVKNAHFGGKSVKTIIKHLCAANNAREIFISYKLLLQQVARKKLRTDTQPNKKKGKTKKKTLNKILIRGVHGTAAVARLIEVRP